MFVPGLLASWVPYVKRNDQTGIEVFESNMPSCCDPRLVFTAQVTQLTRHIPPTERNLRKVCKSGKMHLGWKKICPLIFALTDRCYSTLSSTKEMLRSIEIQKYFALVITSNIHVGKSWLIVYCSVKCVEWTSRIMIATIPSSLVT